MLKLIHIMLSTIQDPVVPVPPPSYTAAMNALPGGDLVETGIRDLEAGVESIPALLASIGAPRLAQLGIAVPNPLPDPEKRLYALLSVTGADSAHSRYNALIRRLVSFERAAACVG
ncbi:MAG TPA: hypothetical protein VFC51_12790 [Chloroflexota bacterium]|nr:hypothetical protein [Chloroflexota bacterium]